MAASDTASTPNATRVLVAFGTKYGSTAPLARAVGEGLSEAGHNVDVLHVNSGIDVRKYDAVVIGSPIYDRKWLMEVRVFLLANEARLADMPVAYFSAGMSPVYSPDHGAEEHRLLLDDLAHVAPEVRPVADTMLAGNFDPRKLPRCLRLINCVLRPPHGDHRDEAAARQWGLDTGMTFAAGAGAQR